MRGNPAPARTRAINTGGQTQGLAQIARGMLGVSIGVVLFGLANGGNFAVVAVEMAAAGAPETLVGLTTSTYFLGTLTASFTCGRLVTRLGHIRAFALFAAIAGLATATMMFVPSIWVWPFLRYLTGFGIGGYYVVVESWFNHAATNDTRGRTLAFYETVRLTSVALGAFVFLSLGEVLGFGVFAATGLLYLAAILPVAMNRQGKPRIETQNPLGIGQLCRRAPLGVACCVVGGLTTAAIYGLLPLYGEQSGLGPRELSAFVSAAHLGAFAVQFPAGYLSDRLGRRGVILLLSLLCAGTALIMGLTGDHNLTVLLLAGTVIGGICHTVHTMGAVYTNDFLDPASYVKGAAALLIAYDVGTVFGPAIASLAMQAIGKGGLFLFIAGFMAMLAVVTKATRR